MNYESPVLIISIGRGTLKYGFYVVFVILIIIYSITGARFLTIPNIISILMQASPLLVLGTGLTIVILMGGIDISVGSTAAVAASVGARLFNLGVNSILVIILMPLIGLCIGVFNSIIVNKIKLNPLLTTLAMLFILKGISFHIINAGVVPIIDNILPIIGNGYIGFLPVPVLIFLFFLSAGQLVMSKTSFGRHILAIGTNESAAKQVGINVEKIKFIAYIICGFTAGFAGLMWASRFASANPDLGSGMEFIGVAIVILGGTKLAGGEGSLIPGTLFGALMFLTIENGLVLAKANIYLYPLVRGSVLFIAILVDSLKAGRSWALT
jgi:ribose transport system permease protein